MAFLGVINDDFEISLQSGREVPKTRRIGGIFGLAGREMDENSHFRQNSSKVFLRGRN